MSKAIILGAVAATGVVAATVPTAIMYGGSSGQLTGPFIPQLDSASDIREKYKEVKCLQKYFGAITFNGTTKNQLQTNHIGDFDSNSESCLIVEYNKKTYKDDKWQGSLRLIWAVKDETNNQGLITVTHAKTVDGEMKGNSAAYILNKSATDNSWTTKHKQETRLVKKKGEKNDFDNLIPQGNSAILGTIGTGNHWGFDADLSKICPKDSCTENETKVVHNSYSWDFIKDSESSEIYSWNSNIDTWLQQILAWQELKSKMSTVKGKWQVNRTLTR